MKTENVSPDLIGTYMDGRATADEIQKLEALLRADPDFRHRFIEHLNVDDALGEYASAHKTDPVPAPRRRTRPPTVQWFASAASVVIVAGLALWGLSRTMAPSVDGASVEVIAAAEDSGYASGQQFDATRVAIAEGWLNLRLESGVTIELAGPADLEIIDPMHLSVQRGSVMIDVGEQTEGFVIDTATTRVIDLGTRFTVNVDQAGETDVVVLEGEVELHSPRDSSPGSAYANLFAGDALTIGSSDMVRRLTAVSMQPGMPRLDRGGGLGVVTGISDDVTDPNYRRFYGLVPGGMRENAPAYTTIGRARWHPAVGEEFPAELLGADAVRTFHDDRRNWDLNIFLDVAGPSSVYVMVDARNPTPDWLRDEFTDTGMQLRTGPWRDVGIVDDLMPDADGGLYVTYCVWKREVLAAGTVSLGPPRTPGQPGNRAMYGIAVQAM
jgi:hypothetical protein